MSDLSHITLLMEFHVDPKDFSSAANESTWFLFSKQIDCFIDFIAVCDVFNFQASRLPFSMW